MMKMSVFMSRKGTIFLCNSQNKQRKNGSMNDKIDTYVVLSDDES